MASAGSDAAESPDGRSPAVAEATPSRDSGGGIAAAAAVGGTGVKRASDGEVRDDDKAAGDGVAGPKKKKTGPGSRGVANLTPEQLAKKRANDREAQRAIRERTKNQIDALEKRIQELTNLKPYQELQAVVRAKETVEQENADIKRQLASIIGILQPIVRSASSGEVSHVSPCHTFSQPTTTVPSPGIHQYNVTTPATSVSPAANVEQPPPPHQQQLQQTASPGLSDEQTASSETHSNMYMAQLQNQRLQLRQGLNMGGERLGLDFLLRPGQRLSAVPAGVNGAQDSPQYHHVPMKHDWSASHNDQEAQQSWASSASSGQLPETAALDPYRHSGSPATLPHHPLPLPQQQYNSQTDPDTLPYYARPIKHSEPSCALDSLLLNFLSERRQRIADGIPIQEVIGPRYPSVSSLLNPSNSQYSHPLSRVFTDILSAFPGISRLPERVASLYVMFLLVRWQLAPTRENFELIPECLAPVQSQYDYAHPAWLDLIPFPAMRERLARVWNPRQYDLDNWFIPFTTSLRVSWPYEETDALLLLPDSEEVVINPVFERHIRNADNWKLGEKFARAFPELVGLYTLDPSVVY